MAQATATLEQPLASTYVSRDALLEDWFTKVDNVTLACWDEGHFWDMSARDTTIVSTQAGAWGAKERCHRRVDGTSCKVRRTRYQNPVTGYLDGPSAVYDYSAYTPGKPYRLPKSASSGYSILDRHTRAAIRVERKRRHHLGEDVGGKFAEETR